jgi:exodeoxyribonuclease VII small subunit
MATTPKTTTELQVELDTIIAWFDSDQVDIDEAVRKYEQGLKLVEELQARLKTAENKIKKIAKA